ncbi:hypothetical protein HN903_04750 [archaeon]|jgi:hypothetical protein|nr:hypothetical protein [archaeon]MBT7129038.1 hypothetical protein [archaeon]
MEDKYKKSPEAQSHCDKIKKKLETPKPDYVGILVNEIENAYDQKIIAYIKDKNLSDLEK